ncbi:hypothetical protein RclHR1_03160003 [Rhizophagus clarus]|uniref:Myb-like domain-containing protein n=1 Tax=Rhizophagus clarus TaxID=94130 RepID=A0A2Z6R7J0_9GLOM|nr:hypothetical protein RclHR1_03160003 [Rhizophagus clarus]GET03639.1 hypothetical protein GLOIN_2v1881065 [Rhizophagus clarus]
MGKVIKKAKKNNKIDKTIDQAGKETIIEHMNEWEKHGKHSKTPFVDLSKKLKIRFNFEPKAICDYWWNILDPRLDHSPFSQEEKNYIYECIGRYKEMNDGNIPWTNLQSEMAKFGKFRSRNDLKNIWNVKKRQLEVKNSGLENIDNGDELNYNNENEIDEKGNYLFRFF